MRPREDRLTLPILFFMIRPSFMKGIRFLIAGGLTPHGFFPDHPEP
jgi:hypothetical protein